MLQPLITPNQVAAPAVGRIKISRIVWIAVMVVWIAAMVAMVVLSPTATKAQQLPGQYTIVPSSPAIPLFRCDGQRPPMFGADQCPNWRLAKKQEELIDLQTRELKRKAKKEKGSD